MMRQDEELWMRKMKEVLKDYSEPPAPEGWDKLQKELRPVEVKRFRPYIWWTAAAVVLLAVSGISLFFIQTPVADDIRHASTPIILTVDPDDSALIKPTDLITQTKPATDAPRSTSGSSSITKQKPENIGIESITQSDPTETVNDNPVVVIKEPVIEPKGETTGKGTSDYVVDAPSDKQPTDDRRIVKPSGKDKLHLPVTSDKDKSSKGKWALAASFSNGAGASRTENEEYLSLASMNTSSDGLANGMVSVGNNQLVFDSGMPYLKQSMAIKEIKHKQPISFGLSVRRNLSNRFSVESGVTYTMLSSEGKSNDSGRKVEQKLHYIGIPIRGNWNFVESKRFTAYVTAGGMVEKCVYGKIDSERHTVKPLQLSLSGGVGGQLNISDRIGLYVEPGISYFFDDGSDVETIRKENPLNFNLQAGIRFTY